LVVVVMRHSFDGTI